MLATNLLEFTPGAALTIQMKIADNAPLRVLVTSIPS